MPVKYGSEDMLHQDVSDYLRLQYPSILFHTDFGSGIKLTMGQAVKQKQLQGGRRSWPDLNIPEPRKTMVPGDYCWACHLRHNEYKEYHGLFIELKKEGTTVIKKNGELVADEHIREQAAVLEKLRERGYKAEFGIGFDNTKKIIDEYLGGSNKQKSIA